MILFGTIVNGFCIIVGSFLGLLFANLKERYKETVMKGIALTVILIGLQMALKTNSIIIVLLSVVSGAIIGEFFQLEEKMNKIGDLIEKKLSKNKSNNVSQAFISATLLFTIGAMSILGALDSGLRGDHEILLTKAILDGFASFVLTTSLGYGVVFSVVPVVLYQGTITILAKQMERIISESIFNEIIMEISAVGGILIVALGMNLLQITKIRVSNLLPSLVTLGFIFYVAHLLHVLN